MKDFEIYKPLGLGFAAAVSSVALDYTYFISEALVTTGKILTGVTMIVTSVYTLNKLKNNAKQNTRKE